MVGPLNGIRVLDLTRVLAGPFSTMTLGDLGAEIIKIENPSGGDDTRRWGPPFIAEESAYFLSLNRDKKSVTLDLNTVEGREILYELAEKCDVLVENFRPGVTEKLQIDYSTITKRNPKLIYCSITSFGPTGPYADRPAYDLVIQGMGGLMGITGERGQGPIRVGVAISDIGGAMYATIAILAAIIAEQRTATGQLIDISLLDGTASWMTYMAANYFATGRNPAKMGSAHPTIVPYQCFETKDREFVTVAIGNDKLFQQFCEAIGLAYLAFDKKFATASQRVINRDELVPILERRFKQETREEWLRVSANAKLPVGPVYSMQELFADPQLLLRRMLVKVTHPELGEISQIGIPMRFSGTNPEIRQAPPSLGQHTDEVLQNLLHYDPGRIAQLRERHVV